MSKVLVDQLGNSTGSKTATVDAIVDASNRAVKSIASLKSLGAEASSDAFVFRTVSRFSNWRSLGNAPVGSADYVWSSSLSKANHNGRSVIAPEAIAAWAGTLADEATLLNWTGAGSGCWVSQTDILAAVATSGDYNDLLNKPDASKFPNVILVNSNITLVVGRSYLLIGNVTVTLPNENGFVGLAKLDGVEPTFQVNNPATQTIKIGTKTDTFFIYDLLVGVDLYKNGNVWSGN